MSTLNVNNIISTSTQSPILQSTGNIVQCSRVRYDSRTTWSSNASGNGTEITPLRLTIAPRHAGNLILCQWVLSGDFHHDNLFTIFRDGGLITTAGEQGYNNEVGNNRWSGFVSSTYDAASSDTGSTPHHWFIQYFCNADSTASRVYAPACRCSGAANYTLFLNRTGSSVGQDGNEMTVSTGVIYEITR
jgi:hypothetical protein